MEQNTLRKQRELTDRLNRYRNEYYGRSREQASAPYPARESE